MKKLFEDTDRKLMILQGFASQTMSAAQASQGVPALYQLSTAFFNVTMLAVEAMLDPLAKQIKDFYAVKGPVAHHARLTKKCMNERSEQEVQFQETFLKDCYPPEYDQDSLNVQKVLDGFICKQYQFGEKHQVFDIFPFDSKIYQSMTQEWWSKMEPIIAVKSESFFDTNGPVGIGAFYAKLSFVSMSGDNVMLKLTVSYPNNCKVETNFNLYCRRDQSYSSTQLTLSTEIPNGWFMPAMNSFGGFGSEFQTLSSKWIGEAYNAYEGVNYPVGSTFFNHTLVRDLFKGLLEKMGVDFNQNEVLAHWGDKRFVYGQIKELIAATPFLKEPSLRYSERYATKNLEYDALRSDYRNYINEVCDEYLLIDDMGQDLGDWHDPTTDIPSGLPVIGTILQYIPRHIPGYYNFNAAVVVNDKKEEATFVFLQDKKVMNVTPTPRTLFYFFESLKKTREAICAYEKRKAN